MLEALLTQVESNLYISRLAVIEVSSAFAGKVRTGHLDLSEIKLLHVRFRGDLRRKLMHTVAITAGHFRQAGRLIHLHGIDARLRTLDAMELAVAISLQNRGLVEIFVCAGKVLCQAAERAGFVVLNPETADR